VNRQHLLGYGWGLLLVLASGVPALLDPLRDSYPFSTYPMFSRHRGQPWVDQLVGIEKGGRERAIEPELIANAETLQASAAIHAALASGKGKTRELCQKVAERVAREPSYQAVRRLEVRGVRYDPIRYFSEQKQPLQTVRHARCRVRRGRRP
jgi:hypothetical protein